MYKRKAWHIGLSFIPTHQKKKAWLSACAGACLLHIFNEGFPLYGTIAHNFDARYTQQHAYTIFWTISLSVRTIISPYIFQKETTPFFWLQLFRFRRYILKYFYTFWPLTPKKSWFWNNIGRSDPKQEKITLLILRPISIHVDIYYRPWWTLLPCFRITVTISAKYKVCPYLNNFIFIECDTVWDVTVKLCCCNVIVYGLRW